MRCYDGTAAHLLDELRRLDLQLRIHLAEWQGSDADDPADIPGLYISDAEVDGLLRQGNEAGRRDERRPPTDELFDQLERARSEIRERTSRTVAEGTELRLVELAERFDLDRRHVDGLLLALAPELDRKYEKIYAYFNDDITRTRPTVGLALDVLCASGTDRHAARAAKRRTADPGTTRLRTTGGTDDRGA